MSFELDFYDQGVGWELLHRALGRWYDLRWHDGDEQDDAHGLMMMID